MLKETKNTPTDLSLELETMQSFPSRVVNIPSVLKKLWAILIYFLFLLFQRQKFPSKWQHFPITWQHFFIWYTYRKLKTLYQFCIPVPLTWHYQHPVIGRTYFCFWSKQSCDMWMSVLYICFTCKENHKHGKLNLIIVLHHVHLVF